MRLSRPRLTLRWALIAVVLEIPIVAGWWWFRTVVETRRVAFRRSALFHRSSWIFMPNPAPERWPDFPALSEYHRSLAEKYDFAARYPWLPVRPDPPEPK